MKNISQQIYANASHTITDIIWDSIENSVENELSDKLWRRIYNGTLRPANPVVRHAVYAEMSEYEYC
jgi:hypothetical protein